MEWNQLQWKRFLSRVSVFDFESFKYLFSCAVLFLKDVCRKELIRCCRPYIFCVELNIFEIFLLGADPEKWLPSGGAKLKSLVYNFLVSFIIVLLPTLT